MKNLKTDKVFYALGLMSGTSLDGLDIAYCKFENIENCWSYKISHAKTISYSKNIEQLLKEAFSCTGERLTELHIIYGSFLGEQVNNFIKGKDLAIDFIASHGHTIFHNPQKKYTFQLGSGAAIAAETNKWVLCDFRTKNVSAGGQGAPLVPIADKLLFSEFDACINLGGFSNISYDYEGKRMAFDICPVNILLNYYAQDDYTRYDSNGELAGKGTVHVELLEKLNKHPYYEIFEVKSLGWEWVQNEILTVIDSFNLSKTDILATLVEHAALQISTVLNKHVFKKVLFTGGGVYNSFLIQQIKKHLNKNCIVIPSDLLVNFKEAMAFAFLGALFLSGQNNILSDYTGTGSDMISAALYK